MWWMNEERQMIAAAAKEFAEQVVAPAAKLMEEEEKYPREAIRQLAELGMLGLTIKEEYGGAGADYGENLPYTTGRTAPIPGPSLRHPGGPGHAGHGGQRKGQRCGSPCYRPSPR